MAIARASTVEEITTTTILTGTPKRTPTRPPLTHHASSTGTPSTHGHRLLYRGGLALPDSLLTLGGLTFVAAKDGGLLDNPLALALESMRGRPTLRLLELCVLDEIKRKSGTWIDEAGDVRLYIHPAALLTQSYFSNAFCMSPTFKDGESVNAVRIGIGDTSLIQATEIIVFARQPPATLPSLTPDANPSLELVVARLSSTPLIRPYLTASGSTTRLPRPDDPTPRKPPLRYFGERRGSSPTSDEEHSTPASKRRKVGNVAEPPIPPGSVLRRAREVMLGLPTARSLSRSKSLSVSAAESTFKVPVVPPKNDKKSAISSDVFGTQVDRKGKATQRSTSVFSIASADGDSETAGEIEAENKIHVKRAAVQGLARRQIFKDHTDFKEVFGYTYRGVSFALRARMKECSLNSDAGLKDIERTVETHLRMYVDQDYGN